MNFVDDVNMLRDDVRRLDERVQDLQKHDFFEAAGSAEAVPVMRSGERIKLSNANVPEMRANLQLAHRHLEDARMRLGKAIQAFEGRDIFDNPKVQEVLQEQRRITE